MFWMQCMATYHNELFKQFHVVFENLMRDDSDLREYYEKKYLENKEIKLLFDSVKIDVDEIHTGALVNHMMIRKYFHGINQKFQELFFVTNFQ